MKRSGLGRYVTTFKDQGIDMDCLTFVQNEQDLSELGVDLSVHRRKLLHLLLHQTKAKQEQVKKVDMKREGDESSTCDDTTVIPTTTGTPTQVDMLGAEPICLGDVVSTKESVVSTKESVVSTKDNVVPSKDSVVPSIESVVPSEEDMLGTQWSDFGLETNGNHHQEIDVSTRTHMESDLREEILNESTKTTAGETGFLQVHDTILEEEHATLMELEEQVNKYKQHCLQERAERYQQAIENERAMIDLQVECDRQKKQVLEDARRIQLRQVESEESCAILRKEVGMLSTRVQELEEQLLSSSHDAENVLLKYQVENLTSTLRCVQNDNEMLGTKLKTAEDMKLFLTSEWERTEDEARRVKEQLLASATDKGDALEFCADMEELLFFLSNKLKIEEKDRGLRLAVKEEWSRMLMGSSIMQVFFEVEKEVNMIPSWKLIMNSGQYSMHGK